METITSTATMVGRSEELGRAREALALAAAGKPQVLVIAGDAGMGKTTLAGTLAEEARRAGQVVLLGHCLDTTEGLPFGPVVESLRALAGRLHDDPDRPAARRVARLMDADHDVDTGRASLFEGLRLMVDEATEHAPVLLWLEDLHWADRSTLDLVAALARTARGRLLICLTVRNEGVHRGSPHRKALMELSRLPGATRIDLDGLDEEGVAALVSTATGAPVDDRRVTGLLARSEGSPLYIEELLAHDGPDLPPTLAELFLCRLDDLSEEVVGLLEAASVGGDRVDPDLLGEVLGISSTDQESLLREALDHRLLRRDGPHLRFRHGLLCQAVYEDQALAVRKRWHRRYAEVCRSRGEASSHDPVLADLIQVAFHCEAAGDRPETLVAVVRAGMAAQRLGAADAEQHLRRALRLWSQVASPEELTGLTEADLLLALARVAEYQADMEQWRDAVLRAVALLTPASDPLLASRVYAARGALPDTSDPGATVEAVRLALELAEGTGSAELARALVTLSGRAARGGDVAAALGHAARARDVAASAGSAAEEVSALVQLATLTYLQGACSLSLEHFHEAIHLARRSGLLGEALLQQGQLAWYLLVSARASDALDMARSARLEAVDAGLPAAAAYCGEQELEALRWEARLDESERMLSDMLGLGMPLWRWRFFQAEILIERGDAAGALPWELESIEEAAKAVERTHDSDMLRQVRLFLMLGQIENALGRVQDYLRSIENLDLPLVQAAGARAAYQAIHAAAEAGLPVAAELARRAAGALAAAAAGENDQWSHSYYGLQLRLAEIYATRTAGDAALDLCREATRVADGLGACLAFTPRLLYAEELLSTRRRDEGRIEVTRVWTAARAAGAALVAHDAATLARRHRLPLDESDSTPEELLSLTGREHEVLDLLVTGAPNKAIARRLLISEKTVSVHVTNLMAKLGVSTRGEAAALKRRIDDSGR